MKKRGLFIAIVCVVIALLVFGIYFRFFSASSAQPPITTIAQTAASSAVTTVVITSSAVSATAPVATSLASTETAYQSPIDFPTLQAQNPDVFAWITIPGSEIQYPVLQSETDDTFYLSHDLDGNESSAGTIFSEHVYNSRGFSDPVTILYGHRRKDMTMFSALQPLYSDETYFRNNREIIIYLPDSELHYRIFAAVPYDNRHILYTYDFTNPKDFISFFDGIFMIRAIGSNLIQEEYPDYDDHILILSTCLWGNKDERYLVIAKQITE